MKIKFLVGFVVSWQIVSTVYVPCTTAPNWGGGIGLCPESVTKDVSVEFETEQEADEFIATKPSDPNIINLKKEQKQ